MTSMIKTLARGAFLSGAVAVGLSGAALAQDLPKTPLKVVGAWGNLT